MYLECCKIVGVKPGADEATIKTAYRKAAKELHPDLNASENAHRYFIILQNAYKYLLENPNPENFRKFNRTGEMHRRASHRYTKSSSVRTGSKIKPNQNLNDIIKHSQLARFLFILFHILFLTAGLYLIYTPVYNVIKYPLNPETQDYTSYFVMLFAFVMGIVFTAVFLISGITYLKRK